MAQAFYGHQVFKGRGATSNPVGRFEQSAVEKVSDGWYEEEPPTHLAETVSPDSARSVITTNNSPDVGFDLSINPYRGCSHACVYCFARPSHSYLGLSPGLDFETKLFYKADAARILEEELSRPIRLQTNRARHQHGRLPTSRKAPWRHAQHTRGIGTMQASRDDCHEERSRTTRHRIAC
jgi:hypothetical protein